MVRITKYQCAIWHIDALIVITTNNICRMGMGVEGDALGAHSFQRGSQTLHVLNLHMFKYFY